VKSINFIHKGERNPEMEAFVKLIKKIIIKNKWKACQKCINPTPLLNVTLALFP
jgi:hypothetical protein